MSYGSLYEKVAYEILSVGLVIQIDQDALIEKQGFDADVLQFIVLMGHTVVKWKLGRWSNDKENEVKDP